VCDRVEERMPLEDIPLEQDNQGLVKNKPEEPSLLYWSDADVFAGKQIYMPTGRIASLFRVEPDGRKIFITPDGFLVCEHGERPSTILSWVSKEKEQGCGPEQRNSCCDCVNSDGMHFTKRKPKPSELPPKPDSLYTFLEGLDTQKICVDGRLARHVPHTIGKKAMFLTQKGGNFTCRHAHTLSTLRKMRKVRMGGSGCINFRGGMCDCELDYLPQRTGLKMLSKLSMLPGKFGKER
jgi:hypothetical protein